MDPAEDPAFRALVEQAKRVCARNPALLPPYLAAIRERGRGLPEEALKAILDGVRAATARSS
ncbi:MAG TPA: hypothetical protein VLH58_13710 [Candidatus Methylomirabilis sp.]|nr:hypothetical protein [Candidatus Methylomirabilis sp.]HSC72407.1 hypothetical protein [Candidatus Methylomirabilis sp.]